MYYKRCIIGLQSPINDTAIVIKMSLVLAPWVDLYIPLIYRHDIQNEIHDSCTTTCT
jgi:hypothetical protein